MSDAVGTAKANVALHVDFGRCDSGLCWWMWGVLGAFIAVPLLATVKIFCDHLEHLAPVGEFLGK